MYELASGPLFQGSDLLLWALLLASGLYGFCIGEMAGWLLVRARYSQLALILAGGSVAIALGGVPGFVEPAVRDTNIATSIVVAGLTITGALIGGAWRVPVAHWRCEKTPGRDAFVGRAKIAALLLLAILVHSWSATGMLGAIAPLGALGAAVVGLGARRSAGARYVAFAVAVAVGGLRAAGSPWRSVHGRHRALGRRRLHRV